MASPADEAHLPAVQQRSPSRGEKHEEQHKEWWPTSREEFYHQTNSASRTGTCQLHWTKKRTHKSKHKECALCTQPLPDDYAKKLCAECIMQTLRQENIMTPSDVRAIIREEMQGLAQTEVAPVPVSLAGPGLRLVRSQRVYVFLQTKRDLSRAHPRLKGDFVFPTEHDGVPRWERKEIRRRYPFSDEDLNTWSKVPKVDAAVASTTKQSVLPVEDSGVLTDPLDRKAEALLKRSWEVNTGAFRPAISSTCTARSLLVWTEQLEEQIRGKTSRESILLKLPQIKEAVAFLADASVDSLRLAARSAGLVNTARRALWLKNWKGDAQAKAKLCAIPCQGEFLFGKTLDELLNKAGERKKGFPNQCVMAGIDLKDAYYHLPIHAEHQQYLRVAVTLEGKVRHFQYVAMPFGLSMAPRVFTKELGWIVNFEKSRLNPETVQTFLGIQLDSIHGTNVRIYSDNSTAVAYLNRQGGTKSGSLMTIAANIFQLAEAHLTSLTALHIKGVENIRADYLSRNELRQGEWTLNKSIFRRITEAWGIPQIDLFATRDNRQVQRFASLNTRDHPDMLDSLHHPWRFRLAYAFPPMSLIPLVIRKIRREQARVILIAPFWPKRPWFSCLQTMCLCDPWILPSDKELLYQGPFFHPQGHKKGHGVTRATISRWIREAICLAYTSKGEIPPVGIKAHSTRAMASSWAEQADVPIHLICSSKKPPFSLMTALHTLGILLMSFKRAVFTILLVQSLCTYNTYPVLCCSAALTVVSRFQSLNEIMESADAPLEVTEGFIQTISLSVPWGSLLQDNCALEVKGLEMVFRPRPRPRSASEPMYWSSFMTSSMQLARECLSQKLTDDQESSQPFEGLEKFAETIETVLRRVRVTFIDTVFRIENIPENSKTGCALEMRISRTVYCDETVDDQSGINVHRPSAFAHKVLELSGVSFFWDEFDASARSSPVSSTLHVETEPKLSPSWNPKPVFEPHPQFTRSVTEVAPSEPVQIASLVGRIELGLILKQNEVLPGAKLDVDGRVDSFHVFLSPRQVHLLLDMLSSIAGPETSSRLGMSRKDRKSRPMQQEDEMRLQMELKRYLRKEDLSGGASADHSFYETDTAKTPSSHDEEVFFSMADMDMSHSLSSLPPLGDPPTVDLDLSLNSTYNNSPVGSPLGGAAAAWSDYQDHGRSEEPVVQGASFKPSVHQNSLRRTSLPNRSVSVDDSRPELVFRLALGSLSFSVLHIDPLPPTASTSSPNPLTPLSLSFFTRIETLDPQTFAQNDFSLFRSVFAEACRHDHLRFIGTQIKISHEQRQRSGSRCYSTDVRIGQTELLECLFPSDSQSAPPQYTELLKFTPNSDPDHRSSPCVHLRYKHSENRGAQGSSGRLSSLPQRSELLIHLSAASCELDITIVDRLNSLLQAQKLGTVEMMTSHLFTSYNKHISLHKDFPEVLLDDSRSPANTRTSVLVSAPSLHLAVRFPIPDLRSDQERGPWFKKSLQKEVLHLNFSDAEFKTEVLGGCSPEQLKLEFTFKELAGAFQEESDGPQTLFIRVVKKSDEVDGDMTTSDNFDWPRIVLRINPIAVHSILERVSAEEDDEGDGRFQEDDEGTSHSLKDVCDYRRPKPSPFSSRRVMFENEEMVMPGDAIEMTEFQEKAISNSHYVLELTLPSVSLMLPNKVFYEKLYNRISNDLLLWEPTAPSPVETFENLSYGIGLSVASQLINTFSKDSSGAFKSTLHYDEDSGSEEETLQYDYILDSNYHSRRKRKLECSSKQSQSFLSVLVNVNHGLVSIFTDVKQSDGRVVKDKHGELWLEFTSGSLFTVTKYEGLEDKHFLCLHASSLSLYHQGVVDGVVVSADLRLPSLPQPHWLEPTIYPSGEDGSHRASSNGVGMDTMSMLTVAVKIQSEKSDRNTKEFLVAVGLRGATLKHRVLQSERTWHEQILQFLNISDEPVLGYSPPTSITTFHVHLWSCALDYRPLYLPIRALLTVETFSISCSVALDKSSSSLRIILDEAALHLSDRCNAVSVNLSRDYVRVLDMGLLELTILAVKFGEENRPRFEMYCSSDVIHIRTCSDSCAALMNLIQYIASYGDLHPPARPHTSPGAQKKAIKVKRQCVNVLWGHVSEMKGFL
ncbi:unnamed protein product [Ranitomeya imitator]|uniref:Lamina-associated polypeptide 2 alpha C-terminal domain-containing protein n=1 Tax=Ranitomeya imitator TaxID=111125 RepID=A0ABN9LNT3_9NEOB|nr:unnamed protein product [Ranitomeya imitator]